VPSRRGHLRSSVEIVALLLAAVSAVGAAAEPANQRPNILFALADDWAWPHAGGLLQPLGSEGSIQ
jgi:hypothetical protein